MTEIQFNLLMAFHQNKEKLFTADILGVSESKFQDTLNYLKQEKLISDGKVTAAGYKFLEPYKVDSAIIMAAGISSRCLPFSKIIPKGLFQIKGEILLERQIEQLKAAGINQIILVIGYLKEQFYYLKDKYGVVIIENDDYIERNNNHSLYLAQQYMKNSYICCSDLYYPQNVFSDYEYDSYFACRYSEDYVNEFCIEETENDYITKIHHGGSKCWYTMGHVYFNRAVSEKFFEFLNIEHNYPEIKGMIFDDFHIRHINQLPARIKKFDNDKIIEFDTLVEFLDFDSNFRQFIIDNSKDVDFVKYSKNNWLDEYSGIKRYSTIPTEQKTGRLHLNENLYLPSPVCLEVLKNISLEDISIYDAVKDDILEVELGSTLGLPVQNIFVHNGSSDVIKTLLNLSTKKNDTILIPNLAWNYYKAIVNLKLAKCVTYNIMEDTNKFCHDIDDILIRAKILSPKVIIITTPNNPTGNSMSDESLKKIIAENPNSLVLVDEAYWGFSDITYNYREYLDKFPNVVFARTLSKFYGLAGARIGFGVCPEKAKEIIDLDLPTFRTSCISRKLGAAVLKDTEYYTGFKKKIIETREYFCSELNKINGIKAFDSDANFVFVRFDNHDVKKVKSWLSDKGIAVRLVSEGKTQGLRITIGPQKIMEDALKIIFEGIRT